MLPDCSTFQKQNVQTYEYVFHDINGQNHRQTLKIPWYLLNEIYMVTHYPDCSGKDKWTKLYWNLDGSTHRIGNVCSFIENNGVFLSENVDDIKMAGKKQNKYVSHVEEIDEKMLILMIKHHLLTMFLWDVPSVNANRTKQLSNNTRRCLNHVFLLEQQKKTRMANTSRTNCRVVL